MNCCATHGLNFHMRAFKVHNMGSFLRCWLWFSISGFAFSEVCDSSDDSLLLQTKSGLVLQDRTSSATQSNQAPPARPQSSFDDIYDGIFSEYLDLERPERLQVLRHITQNIREQRGDEFSPDCVQWKDDGYWHDLGVEPAPADFDDIFVLLDHLEQSTVEDHQLPDYPDWVNYNDTPENHFQHWKGSMESGMGLIASALARNVAVVDNFKRRLVAVHERVERTAPVG